MFFVTKYTNFPWFKYNQDCVGEEDLLDTFHDQILLANS